MYLERMFLQFLRHFSIFFNCAFIENVFLVNFISENYESLVSIDVSFLTHSRNIKINIVKPLTSRSNHNLKLLTKCN